MSDLFHDRQHAKPAAPRALSALERLGLRGAAQLRFDCAPMEASILVALVEAKGPLNWNALEEKAYWPNRAPSSAALRVMIMRLRRRLEQKGAKSEILMIDGRAGGYDITERAAMLANLITTAEMLD